MSRTLENKQAIVAELKQTLSESQLALVINYQGLTVSEITDLRRRLRPTGTICTVTKNTLMGIAVDGQNNWQRHKPCANNALWLPMVGYGQLFLVRLLSLPVNLLGKKTLYQT